MCRWGLIHTPTLLCQWECGPGLAWTVNVVSHVYRVATKDTHEVHIWQLRKGELLQRFSPSVGRPVAKTQSQKPTLDKATGYSQMAKWLMAVRSNLTAIARPMIFLDGKVGWSVRKLCAKNRFPPVSPSLPAGWVVRKKCHRKPRKPWPNSDKSPRLRQAIGIMWPANGRHNTVFTRYGVA